MWPVGKRVELAALHWPLTNHDGSTFTPAPIVSQMVQTAHHHIRVFHLIGEEDTEDLMVLYPTTFWIFFRRGLNWR